LVVSLAIFITLPGIHERTLEDKGNGEAEGLIRISEGRIETGRCIEKSSMSS
jgi:hypothetical protein